MLNKILSRFNLFTKIAFLAALIIISFVFGIYLVYNQSYNALFESKKSQVTLEVETAYSVVEHFYNEYAEGNMPLEEAQTAALYFIGTLRYEGTNYFFVMSSDHVILQHPTLEIGSNQKDTTDEEGTYLFQDIANVALTDGSGYTEYYWDKTGEGDIVRKITYLEYNEEWDWIVGSGMYVDDFEASVAQITSTIMIIVVVIVLVSAVVTIFLANSISRPVRQLVEVAKKLSLGALDHQLELGGRDEVGQLTNAFQEMITSQQEISAVAEEIAEGNLAVQTTPRSEEDVLGKAHEKMILNLRKLIRDVRNNSNSLTDASRQLATASDQAGQASNQIGTTIQQVAIGEPATNRIRNIHRQPGRPTGQSD